MNQGNMGIRSSVGDDNRCEIVVNKNKSNCESVYGDYCGSDSKSGSDHESESDSESVSDTESGSDNKSESDSESGSDNECMSSTESGSHTESGSESESDLSDESEHGGRHKIRSNSCVNGKTFCKKDKISHLPDLKPDSSDYDSLQTLQRSSQAVTHPTLKSLPPTSQATHSNSSLDCFKADPLVEKSGCSDWKAKEHPVRKRSKKAFLQQMQNLSNQSVAVIYQSTNSTDYNNMQSSDDQSVSDIASHDALSGDPDYSPATDKHTSDEENYLHDLEDLDVQVKDDTKLDTELRRSCESFDMSICPQDNKNPSEILNFSENTRNKAQMKSIRIEDYDFNTIDLPKCLACGSTLTQTLYCHVARSKRCQPYFDLDKLHAMNKVLHKEIHKYSTSLRMDHMRQQRAGNDCEDCIGCGLSFLNLIAHLKNTPECCIYHDMEVHEQLAKEKIRIGKSATGRIKYDVKLDNVKEMSGKADYKQQEKVLQKCKETYVKNLEARCQKTAECNKKRNAQLLETYGLTRDQFFYMNNKEKRKEESRQAYIANAEKAKQRNKKWVAANGEKVLKIQQHCKARQNSKLSKECGLTRDQLYYKENKEKVLERKLLAYKANREKILESQLRYRASQKFKDSEGDRLLKRRLYYKKNRTKILEKGRLAAKANPEEVRLRKKKWREANKERILEIARLYRAKRRAIKAESAKKELNIIVDSIPASTTIEKVKRPRRKGAKFDTTMKRML